MIVVLKPGLTAEEIHKVVERIESFGLRAHLSEGKERTIIGAIGDERLLVDQTLESFPGVEKVLPILKPYKLVSREFQKSNTIIEVNSHKIGGKRIHVMAGPCSVESRDQVLEAAIPVKEAGGTFLRGGAFKPRTSPYSFRGLEEKGLQILAEARKETGLPVVTEVMSIPDIDVVARYADVLQIGARNAQNFNLLEEVGRSGKPVLLKRGLASRIEDWLLAAEYILAQGNRQVMLCERGIRTFETATRNTFDINAIPLVKKLSHLPVIADPSHGTGKWYLVEPVALASLVAGADGVIVEVHPNPDHALSDGAQSLTFENFEHLARSLASIGQAVGRPVAGKQMAAASG